MATVDRFHSDREALADRIGSSGAAGLRMRLDFSHESGRNPGRYPLESLRARRSCGGILVAWTGHLMPLLPPPSRRRAEGCSGPRRLWVSNVHSSPPASWVWASIRNRQGLCLAVRSPDWSCVRAQSTRWRPFAPGALHSAALASDSRRGGHSEATDQATAGCPPRPRTRPPTLTGVRGSRALSWRLRLRRTASEPDGETS
jgi:hypothetical protein